MDIKFNKDGPVTFGALGGTYPQMNAQAGEFAVVSGIVRNGVLGPAVGDVVRPDNAASVKITMKDTGVTYSADSGILGDPVHRFGPVLNEYHKTVELTNHIASRWSIRKFVGFETPVVDLTIENCWAYEPGPQNFQYDVEVTIGGKVVYSGPALEHYHHGRWRMVFNDYGVTADYPWSGTKAVPNYDPAFQPAESILAKMAALALDDGPMRLAAASPYMPETGGNDEIGLAPQWSAAWVLSKDSRARDCMLATANCAGSYGIHFRDKETDLPISLNKFPYMTIDGNYGDTWNEAAKRHEAFPGIDHGVDGTLNNSPYIADTAHHPSLAYIPYLATGDYYYLEEMQFWAMYNMLKANPSYRLYAKGVVQSEQLRGQAWALRTLAEAAAFTPDDHPLKTEMVGYMNNNLDWYNYNYPNNLTANKLGIIANGYAIGDGGGTQMKPWMHDFFVSAMGHALDLGFENARPIFEYTAKFTVARMTAPGMCWTVGAPYILTVRDTSSSPIYDTVAQCYTHDLGEAFMALPCGGPEMGAIWGAKVGDMGGISSGYMGYPSNMQPALAYAVDYGIPGAQRAFDLFMSRTVKPDYRLGPQFSIVPRSYAAQYVAPIVDPDTLLDWQQIAIEGQTVTVPADTTVRFGANGSFIKKLVSGPVTANNATFGFDPAPNVAKVLQQLIPQPPEGNTMTFKLHFGEQSFVKQTGLPAGTEAQFTSLLYEVFTADGSQLLGSSTTPEVGGLELGTVMVKYSGIDSKGAVIGKPYTELFTIIDPTPPDVPVDPPAPVLVDVLLPGAATITVTKE